MNATETSPAHSKPAPPKKRPAFLRRIWRRKWWVVITVAAIVLALRLYLPIWVLNYVNRKINETPGYSGSIQDVDIHLYRGAYVIREISIYKSNGKVPVPFFAAPKIDLSVEWKALFDGAFVGEIDLDQPKMNFVKGPGESQSQVGVDKPWGDKIKQLFPLKINRFHVEKGEVHYHDFHSQPKVDLVVSDLYMTCTNLTNSAKLSKSEVAKLQAEAKPLRTGRLKVDVDIDPYQENATFDLKAEMADIPLTKLNDMTRAYAFFDFQSGNFAVATEMKADNGKISGYIKPVFDHMQILSLQQDAKNPVKLLWEGLLEGVGRILRNQPKDRFATKVPLSGNLKDPQGAVLVTIGNVFKNAFIQVFSERVEGNIDTSKAREE